MKKIILMAALPFAFMACKNSGSDVAKEARTQQMTIDSLKTEIVKQQIIDSMNRVATIPVNNPLNNEAKVIVVPVAQPVASVSKPKSTHTAAKRKTRRARQNYNSYNDNAYAGNYNSGSSSSGSGNYDNGSSYNSGSASYDNNYAQPVQQQQKKGWNSKVKGSVIGAGAGAIAGALIDRKKGRGAILGGLLGGGAGLGIGALLDKRQGN
jgi:hypothetical protein